MNEAHRAPGDQLTWPQAWALFASLQPGDALRRMEPGGGSCPAYVIGVDLEHGVGAVRVWGPHKQRWYVEEVSPSKLMVRLLWRTG